MGRDSMVLYRSFIEAAEDLPAEEFKECFLALARYAMDGKEPENMTPTVKLFFTLTQPQIDANNRKYKNGTRGGRPPAKGKAEPKAETEEPNENQTETKQEPNRNQTGTKQEPNKTGTEPNVNVNDNVNANVNVSEYEKHEPTKEQVIVFFKSKGMTEDEADRFYNYNQAKGWKAGKNHIADWQAAALLWQSRQRDFSRSSKPGTRFNNFGNQQEYDFDQLEKVLAQ